MSLFPIAPGPRARSLLEVLVVSIPVQLAETLRHAKRVVVLTGAGVSAESNIPTFRDVMTGLWSKYRAEDLATPEAFKRDPALVWNWYQWRRQLVANAVPNPGHLALARLAGKLERFTLVTQNVDNLHQRAGSPEVLELHGNITRTKCSREHRLVESWHESEEVPPRCPSCGSYLRPDVVWFGESLPMGTWDRALAEAAACEIFFSIGTSALVQPAASLIYQTMRSGGLSVEINPQTTSQSHQVTHALAGPSGIVLPALLEAAWPGQMDTNAEY